jgi:hypothetical protein
LLRRSIPDATQRHRKAINKRLYAHQRHRAQRHWHQPRGISISPERHRHRAQRGIAIEPTEASPSSPQRHHHRAHRGITIEPTEASTSSPQRHQHRAHRGIAIELTAASTPSSLEASAAAQRHWHQPSGIAIEPTAASIPSSTTGSNHPPQHQRVVFRTSFIGRAIASSSLHDIH